MPDITLESPAFDHGEPIPDRHGYHEANVNPPLSIEGVPADASSLALVMDDPDAMEPAGTIWDHWIVWNVPTDATIPAGWDPAEAGATEGVNDFDERGYGGPAPPDGEHTYRFRLYALEADVDLPPTADKEGLGNAMDDHVIEKTRLEGTYAP